VSRIPKDLPFGLVLCAVGGVVASVANALPSIAAQAYGPGFFPSLLGVALAACGLIMVVRSLLQMRSRPVSAAPAVSAQPGTGRRNLAAIAWVVGGLAIIAVGLETIGFLICVPVFMIGYMAIVGERLPWAVVLSLVTTGIAYYAFAKLLKVQIPMGVLQGLF
jgi:putative tricarboxylic transport membrane protein